MAETLGERLRSLRHERGLRLADVSSTAGISLPWLADMERDRARPSLETLVRVAAAFDMTAIELLRGVSPYDRL